MKRWRMALAIPLILLIVVAFVHTLLQDRQQLTRALLGGAAAPDFSVMLADGSAARLSDYKGKGVILNFWGTWCEPCVNEMPRMNEAYRTGVPGVEILAVNGGESRGSVTEFVTRLGLTFPIALDPSGEAANLYGVAGLPATFLVDADGRLVRRVEGELASAEDVLRLMKQVQP